METKVGVIVGHTLGPAQVHVIRNSKAGLEGSHSPAYLASIYYMPTVRAGDVAQ